MEKKFHYLYKITHIKSKKIYIGIHSTDNLKDGYFANGVYESKVKKNAWSKLNHGHDKHTHMRSALVKHGRSAFKKEIIKTFKSRKAALKEEEKLVTKEFINRDDNFNHRTGGIGNVEFSEEVREKISKNNPMHRADVRKKVSLAQKQIWTPEKKEELSKNNPMHDPEIRNQHTGENSSWFGREHSDESKRKMSVANAGKKQTKKTIEKKTKSQKNTLKKATEILDKKTNKKFNSLSDLRNYLRDKEGLRKGIGVLSEIARGLRPHDKLHNRIIYTKQRYSGKPEARIFQRGKIWQVRIWIPKDKKHFKKSLGTMDKKEALKLAKIEEKRFYN